MNRLLLSIHVIWLAPGRLIGIYAESREHAHTIAAEYLAGRTATDAAGRAIREISR